MRSAGYRAAALLLGALVASHAWAQQSPPAAGGEDEAAPKQLETVTVTGSRIPRAVLEGPSPVTTITAQEIDAKGYHSVYDALAALTQNTGMTQGQDFGSTFTPAGSFLNLRNLGPNHTLVLVNGHRQAEYPVAYDGSVNAVNLANIPAESIERIEILDAGASAVYGSDAIAGVVNIILKKHYDGTDIKLRTGGTQGGGGANQRLQLTHGIDAGRLSGVVGLELNRQQPIRYGDRHVSASYLRGAPAGTSAPVVAGVRDAQSGNYVDPPAGACDALSGYLRGSIGQYATQASGRSGSYCGSDRYYDDRTIESGKKQVSGFASLDYRLDDEHELYGVFLADETQIRNIIRAQSWSSDSVAGPFWNAGTQRLESWTRVFTPEEAGGLRPFESSYLERSWSASLGSRGRFGDSDWHYDANYSLSEYRSNQSRYRLLAGLDDYFLGAPQGTHAVGGSLFPVYAPDAAKLYAPLSPGAFAGLVDRSTGKNRSWTQTLSLSVNGTLADLPGGELALAGVLEAGSQGYRDTPDARIDQGVFWGASSAEPAGGTRRNQAVGVEVSAPVLASLTLSGAARYDRFGFAGHSIGKATYNVGLEYRPLDSLLLRGSYATSFRAPDMNYIYATRTLGYYPEQTDDYQCRLAGQAYGSCDKRYDMDYSQGGNARLKPETARSFTYGLVWSPGHGVDLSLDYYRITISDEVTNLSVDQLLRTEADCRVGMTQGGAAVDPSSAQCRDAYARIARNPGNAPVNPNQVTAVQVNPINAASERTSGIDASANLRWDGGRAGRFGLNLAYTAVLDHSYRQFAGDATQDLLSLSYQSEWRSRANATLDWSRGDWTATLAGTRYGRFPTNDYQGYRGPYVLFNGSVGYQLDRRTRLSLAVNNLANRMPVDHTAGWPGYPSSVYDIYGRQWWLQVDYHFGGKR